MKKSLLITSLLAVALASTSCAEQTQKKKESNNYQVSLYNATGTIIKQWTSIGKVTGEEGWFHFIDKESGKKILVSGTVIIEAVL